MPTAETCLTRNARPYPGRSAPEPSPRRSPSPPRLSIAGGARARLQRIAAAGLAAQLAGCLLNGCVSLPRTSYSEAESRVAVPAGLSGLRYRAEDPALAAMLGGSLATDPGKRIAILALSGGGANGAYAAGYLSGWTASGARPQFRVVTGVSIGALTAPFAFLGSAQDASLRAAWSSRDVGHALQLRWVANLFTPGIYEKSPLRDLLRRYVTNDMIAAIAREQASGRRLLVATTDLDSQEPYVWDLGAIAAQGTPASRALFIDVLSASASLPGVFKPSMISARVGDREITEMHVDGQTQGAFFSIPRFLFSGQADVRQARRIDLYVVIDGRITNEFKITPRRGLNIMGRAMETALKSAVNSQLATTFEYCRANGCRLLASELPRGSVDAPLDFREQHIQSLLRAGEAMAGQPDRWNLSQASHATR